ncbi:MAG: YjbQ family protein, partial [Bacteroidetes bacterium]|nr:YjbQ family protein [Bacteroidota bacterium]
MSWLQKEITLSPKPRGFHLVTNEVLKLISEIKKFSVGIAHIFIKHTSASLSINENADPTVRADMETHFNAMVPEEAGYYQHTFEGLDDMTSHIKTSIIGSSITIPIKNGSINLG